MQHSLFPAFRSRFVPEAAWTKDTCAQEGFLQGPEHASSEPLVRMAGCGGPAAAGRGTANFIRPLMLDLNTLPREEGPPSESVLKRQKFAVFEKHCSQVADGLYVSGEAVARDRSILAQHNISHVVNCVGALYPEYFKADGIQYKTLWLQDHPQEDITCVLYDTFDFIEAARKGSSGSTSATSKHPQQQQQRNGGRVPPLPLQQQQQQQQSQQQQSQPRYLQQQQQQLSGGGGCGGNGRVLVHCSQGVSRSTTIAIAYLMWKTGGSYDEVYTAVRALRGVTSPNVGFMCQLINWAKRRQRPPTRVRLYRISPHCQDAPLYLVPRAVGPPPGRSHPDWSQLDPRGCFVAHLHDKVYVWRGQHCMHSMLEAGLQAAARLSRYEGAPAAQVVRQGEEPEDLLAALAPANGTHSSASTCETSSCCTRADSAAAPGEPSSNNLVGAAAAAAAAAALGAAAGAVQPAAAVAACSGGWASSQQQQQEAADDGDTEMTSVPPDTGTDVSSAEQPPSQQQQEACASQQPPAGAAVGSQTPGSSSQLQSPRPAAAAADAAAAAAALAPAGDAAAAAAAAQVLLGVQLGPAGGLKALQQVPEYDADFSLWLGALHRSSQSEGGRHTPRSPLTAAGGGAWEEGCGQSPKPGSPAGLNKKYSRSDSEGRSVVPSCRQPGRLSTSSSQAWPDVSVPNSAAGGGGYVAAAAGEAVAEAAAGGAMEEDGAEAAAAAADGVVEMRQSSTG